MTGKRKDRLGFSMIELLVVIAVIAVLAAIGIFGMSDSRNRYECERTAGAVRDFLVEGMAHASKISRDVPIALINNNNNGDDNNNNNNNNNNWLLGCMAMEDGNNNQIVLWSDAGVPRSIRLGTGERLVDDVRLYSFAPGQQGQQGQNNDLIDQNGRVNGQQLAQINIGANNANLDGFFLRAKGPAIMMDQDNGDGVPNQYPVLLLRKGNYHILMRIGGNGNVNMYLAKGDSDAGIETLQFNAIK